METSSSASPNEVNTEEVVVEYCADRERKLGRANRGPQEESSGNTKKIRTERQAPPRAARRLPRWETVLRFVDTGLGNGALSAQARALGHRLRHDKKNHWRQNEERVQRVLRVDRRNEDKSSAITENEIFAETGPKQQKQNLQAQLDCFS
jgi:hypothetical protein